MHSLSLLIIVLVLSVSAFAIVFDSNKNDELDLIFLKHWNENFRRLIRNDTRHFPSEKGGISIDKKLLDFGLSVNHQNNLGETALHVACYVGAVEQVKILLNMPGINAGIPDIFEFTPVMIAAAAGQVEIVTSLYKRHDVNSYSVNDFGYSPLDYTLDTIEKGKTRKNKDVIKTSTQQNHTTHREEK